MGPMPLNFFLLCLYGLYYEELGLQPLEAFKPLVEEKSVHSQCYIDSFDVTWCVPRHFFDEPEKCSEYYSVGLTKVEESAAVREDTGLFVYMEDARVPPIVDEKNYGCDRNLRVCLDTNRIMVANYTEVINESKEFQRAFDECKRDYKTETERLEKDVSASETKLGECMNFTRFCRNSVNQLQNDSKNCWDMYKILNVSLYDTKEKLSYHENLTAGTQSSLSNCSISLKTVNDSLQSCLVEKSELHGKHNTSQDELREARESFSNATVEIDEMRKAAKDSKRLVDHLQEELKDSNATLTETNINLERCVDNSKVNATRTEKLVKDLGNCREENRELNSTEQTTRDTNIELTRGLRRMTNMVNSLNASLALCEEENNSTMASDLSTALTEKKNFEDLYKECLSNNTGMSADYEQELNKKRTLIRSLEGDLAASNKTLESLRKEVSAANSAKDDAKRDLRSCLESNETEKAPNAFEPWKTYLKLAVDAAVNASMERSGCLSELNDTKHDYDRLLQAYRDKLTLIKRLLRRPGCMAMRLQQDIPANTNDTLYETSYLAFDGWSEDANSTANETMSEAEMEARLFPSTCTEVTYELVLLRCLVVMEALCIVYFMTKRLWFAMKKLWRRIRHGNNGEGGMEMGQMGGDGDAEAGDAQQDVEEADGDAQQDDEDVDDAGEASSA